MKTLLVLAVIFTTFLALRAAEARAADADPCAGIRLGFHESIAAQGFLGLITPKSSALVTKTAFARGLELSRGGLQGRHDFNWPYVCKLARARGATALWIGCHGDSDEDKSDAYGSYAPKNTFVGIVKAECVVSTYSRSRHPSWDDLVDSALFHSGGDQNTYMEGDNKNRHDELAKPDVRVDLYLRSLKNSIGGPDWEAHENCRKLSQQKYYSGLNSDPYSEMPECNPDL